MNRVTLIGRLGRDPEVRTMKNEDRVAKLSLATSEKWKDKDSGEKRENTEWHRVIVYSKGLVDVCEKYLKKGSRILVEGKLQTRKWTDKDNQARYSTEIVVSGFGSQMLMLDSGNAGVSETAEPPEEEGSDD